MQKGHATGVRDSVRGGVWHEAMVLACLPLAAPIGLSPLHILTLCGSERVLVLSTEPLWGEGMSRVFLFIPQP